jgi:uncharacterized protein YbjT (DUF2867 family)
MKALIIGATGATGKDLTHTLLQDNTYSQIVTFVRKPTGLEHPKFREIVTDFENLKSVSRFIQGDVFFSCLGTTLSAAGTKENQWHVDYSIPVNFAKMAKRNGFSSAVLLSAYGAKVYSFAFYSAMKGQLEKYYAALGFDQCIIFRPGMLLRKDTDRNGERISTSIITFANTLGLFKRFKPLPTSVLAEKLGKAPRLLSDGLHIIELGDIWTF